MPYSARYISKRSKRKNKDESLLKRCKCGNETYQPEGKCVCCNLNLRKLAKAIGK